MKVPCRKCDVEMKYPFRTCKNCGWKPKGKLLKKAKDFARYYEYKHGIDPKEAERGPKGSGPGLVKPPPPKDIARLERIFYPEMIDCPKCGEGIRIHSSRGPVKVRCKECGAKVKVMDPEDPNKVMKKSSAYAPENVECPKCREENSLKSPERPIRLNCKKCGVKIKVVD